MRRSTENIFLRALLAQRRAGEHRVFLATLNKTSFPSRAAQIPLNCTSQRLREISSLAFEVWCGSIKTCCSSVETGINTETISGGGGCILIPKEHMETEQRGVYLAGQSSVLQGW